MKAQPDIAEVIAAQAVIRELTGEAHAAVKDLRLAIREAREMLATLPAAADAAAAAAAQGMHDTIFDHLQQQIDVVKDHEAQLLGAADVAALMQIMVDSITESLISQQDRWLPGNLRIRRGS